MKESNQKILSNTALFFTALIWGLSFVAQKAGMDYVGPFSFNFMRSIIVGISLIPVIYFIKLVTKDNRPQKLKKLQHILLAKAGLSCGTALFIAMSIQQYSMLYSSAGKAGFITSLYIIFVPLISMFFGQKLSKNVKLSIVIALIGLYLLCFKGGISGFDIYDLVLLIGAVFYGIHILVVNYFSKRINPTKVSCLQFFVVGFLSLPLMLLFETPHIQNFTNCSVPILYAGVLTCGVAYTLQIFGQKYTLPVVASLILCLESVFAVIGGGLILHETMELKEILGCIFMISAVIISQIDPQALKQVFRQPSLTEEEKNEDFIS